MLQVDLSQGKVELPKLIASLEKGESDCIVILRNMKPAAMITLCEPAKRQLGMFNGKYTIPDDIMDDCSCILRG